MGKGSMNIYHVERTDGGGGYETYSDFVVVANDEHHARSANPSTLADQSDITEEYDDKYAEWVKYSLTKATLIGKASNKFKERTIICSSFHAG